MRGDPVGSQVVLGIQRDLKGPLGVVEAHNGSQRIKKGIQKGPSVIIGHPEEALGTLGDPNGSWATLWS